jgi:hypothetical protein
MVSPEPASVTAARQLVTDAHERLRRGPRALRKHPPHGGTGTVAPRRPRVGDRPPEGVSSLGAAASAEGDRA